MTQYLRCLALAAALVPGGAAQLTQTLPRDITGLHLVPERIPFTDTNHTIQYHYDTSLFQMQGPIAITEVYLRAWLTEPLHAYDMPYVEIVMASSPTDYSVPGTMTQPGHDPVFANNLNPDVTTVRPGGRFRGLGQSAPDWEPLQLRTPFIYDPSQGLDLVMQIRSCGIGLQWGQPNAATKVLTVQGPVGSYGTPGTVLANEYWNTLTCNEPAHNVQGYEGVGYTRIDFHPATSAFADFYVEGHRAGESVIFDDRSYSPVTGGVVVWLWTFGDGTMSTDENPVHTYACQGSYTVSLLVTDALSNVAMTQRTLTLTPERFTMTTTGGGVGDLCVTPPRLHCFPNVVRGHTLVSLDAHPGSIGQGPFLGLVPDMWTYFTLAQPPGSPNAFHFLAAPGIYPDIPLDVLPGFFSGLAGLPLDAVIIYFDGQGIPVHVSNVAQVVF